MLRPVASSQLVVVREARALVADERRELLPVDPAIGREDGEHEAALRLDEHRLGAGAQVGAATVAASALVVTASWWIELELGALGAQQRDDLVVDRQGSIITLIDSRSFIAR